MAENLIILVAIASTVGVFFLVLFRVLARRERRALRKLKGANPSTRGVGALLISWRVAYAVLWPAHLRLVGEDADRGESRN